MSYILQGRTRFSKSLLWDLQRGYYEDMGFDAFRRDEVPHTITSNPKLADSYAAQVFALYHDLRLNEQPVSTPLTILELGAGSGRFGYHFLKRLTYLCDIAGVPTTWFRYVMTDLAKRNLDFWKVHPLLQTFINDRMLDMAVWDATAPNDIQLEISGDVLSPGSVSLPIVVIANYFFDSIPQELLQLNGGLISVCETSIFIDNDPSNLTISDVLEQLSIQHNFTMPHDNTEEYSGIQQLSAFYGAQLSDGFFFLPIAAIKCIDHLRSLSLHGILLLTADKGEHVLENILYTKAPVIVRHGSISLSVNYHALRFYCHEKGGLALFPEQGYSGINIGSLLFVDDPARFTGVKMAYHQNIGRGGPDECFSIYRGLTAQADLLSTRTILAMLNVSIYDPYQLRRYLPRLEQLIKSMSASERHNIIEAVNQCWLHYYPLAESFDLADAIACFLYLMDEYELAIFYFSSSERLYGQTSGTLYNIACCYRQLGDTTSFVQALELLLSKYPYHKEANKLLAEEAIN